MLFEKIHFTAIKEKLGNGTTQVAVLENCTYTYENGKNISGTWQQVYEKPSHEGMLYIYEIFTSKKELAKKIRKAFKCQSIGKPITLKDYLARWWEMKWGKFCRQLGFDVLFGGSEEYVKYYCLYTIAVYGEVEKKLTSL